MPKQTPSVMSAEGAQCSCAVGHPAAPDLVDLNDFIDLILSQSLKFLSRPRASARHSRSLAEARLWSTPAAGGSQSRLSLGIVNQQSWLSLGRGAVLVASLRFSNANALSSHTAQAGA